MIFDLSKTTRIDDLSENFSIKLVIPSKCNAKCKFCFNHLTESTKVEDVDTFFTNLENSLENILFLLENANRTNISLDITGNEPTFNPEILKTTLRIISRFKSRFTKIVLTSNGFRLEECIPYLEGVVDIVNISTHSSNLMDRQYIFGIEKVLKDKDYIKINSELSALGITTTSVGVLHEPLWCKFEEFLYDYVMWSKSVGFSSLRIRSNFYSNDSYIDDYFRRTFDNEVEISDKECLYVKVLDYDGFEVRLLKGVKDLTDYVVGVEAVIDDDGKCYLDYNKRYPIEENQTAITAVFVCQKL